MRYALVTGGTSGIGEIVSAYLQSKGVTIIITGSRNNFEVTNNMIYINYDQGNIVKGGGVISNSISLITSSLDYVFLNAGVWYPDDSSPEELELMDNINRIGTIEILKELHQNDMLYKARIIVNGSVQSTGASKFSEKYAKTKKLLTQEAISYSQEHNLKLSVIGPSMINFRTAIFEKLMSYYVSQGLYNSEEDFFDKTPMTEISQLLDVLNDVYFGDDDSWNRFIPIVGDEIKSMEGP